MMWESLAFTANIIQAKVDAVAAIDASGSDGFLTLDKNGNGTVADAGELFGTYTGSGFADLAAYDLNHDGKIDAADAVYSKPKVWQDFNGDGVSTPDELHTLADLGIASISLNSHVIGGTTPQGTTLRAGSSFTRTDGTSSAIYEVVFGNDQFARAASQ